MTARPDPVDDLPSLPPAVNDRMFALLYGEPSRRGSAFEELMAEQPVHAASLQAHWRYHQRLSREDELATVAGDETTIPGYRLQAILGEGGMGTVYRAEQLAPVRRPVALKVIKPGMDSKAVLARFEQERQSLAAMDHDAIAKVFDCGTSERGQPYFAMELVEGLPIHRYCDEHMLSLRERIELFVQVCQGVQHAHQKGVIHRDLKPGNVLVADQGGRHAVKIIDFGVARATDRRLAVGSMCTEQGMIVGTPEYMSPEQATGDSRRLDTRTDIYSLGVILYELLVGALPFSGAELREAGIAEIQRRLRDDEPPKPSTRLSTLRGEATTCAALRRVSVEGLRKELASDLDWVVLKAMAKEPERRYESATGLAEDLRRYLQHEPLQAGPPSAWYRLRKMVRRYRGRVAAGGAVFVTAVVGAVVALQFALREQAKVREFDLLSGVVRHEDAIAAERDLYPPWPHKIEAMERWLGEDCGRLLGMREDIHRALQDLEERALPRTDADCEADRRSHPEFAEYESLVQRVAGWRHALSIREGRTQLVLPQLTSEQSALPAETLRAMAWSRVAPLDPGGKAKERAIHGDYAFALACAQRALANARGADDEHRFLETLAWAMLANGQDAEAAARMGEACEMAPDREQEACELRRKALEAESTGRAEMLASAEKALATAAAAVGQRRTFRFAEDSQRLLHRSLRDLLGKLDSFTAKEVSGVQGRLAWARVIQGLSLRHPSSRHAWESVRAAIKASEKYAGCDIALRDEDITGLVPIGENRVTKLWEFYELRSAWDGKSDPATIAIPMLREDGSIEMTGNTGIVFVLLPGGTFRMGAEKGDELAPNVDPRARTHESPAHDVVLSPFFLARHELTKGQWQRLSGGQDPSWYQVGSSYELVNKPIGLAHPVENVNRSMCVELLRQHGLLLPTEAQWEYGCRAATTTPWWVGSSAKDLAGCANVLDQATVRRYPEWGTQEGDFDDGWTGIAPAGSYRMNAFGLHDTHGNVWEWCLDPFGSYSGPCRAGDGFRLQDDGSGAFLSRGGCSMNPAHSARSSHRNRVFETIRGQGLGLRAARALGR